MAARISSATAPNAARHSVSGRASPFSPRPNGTSAGKAFGEPLARGLGADLVVERRALVLQRLERFSSSGAVAGRSARGGRASIAPMVTGAARLAFDAQRGRIEAGRKVARDQRGVALRQIDA